MMKGIETNKKIHKIAKFKKVCITAIMLFVMMTSLLVPAVSADAPQSLSSAVYSTRYGLVSLKVPQYAVSTTNSKRLAISATAPEGTLVTLYKYDADTGFYNKAYLNYAPVEAVVGPTRLFAGQVDLYSGSNKFILRGEASDGTFTIVRFDVTLLNEGFMSRIKSVIDINF